MGWYNSGDWDGVAVSDLKRILHEICWGINEREKMAGMGDYFDSWAPWRAAYDSRATPPVADGATDLVTNGTFDTDASGWTLGTAWSYDSGLELVKKAAATAGKLSQSIGSLEAGKVYRVTCEIETTFFGSIKISLGGGEQSESYSNAIGLMYVSVNLVCGASDTLLYFDSDSSWAGYVDNVTCTELHIPAFLPLTKWIMPDGSTKAWPTEADFAGMALFDQKNDRSIRALWEQIRNVLIYVLWVDAIHGYTNPRTYPINTNSGATDSPSGYYVDAAEDDFIYVAGFSTRFQHSLVYSETLGATNGLIHLQDVDEWYAFKNALDAMTDLEYRWYCKPCTEEDGYPDFLMNACTVSRKSGSSATSYDLAWSAMLSASASTSTPTYSNQYAPNDQPEALALWRHKYDGIYHAEADVSLMVTIPTDYLYGSAASATARFHGASVGASDRDGSIQAGEESASATIIPYGYWYADGSVGYYWVVEESIAFPALSGDIELVFSIEMPGSDPGVHAGPHDGWGWAAVFLPHNGIEENYSEPVIEFISDISGEITYG